MPYIQHQNRSEIDAGRGPRDCGELNYAIHLLLQEYVNHKKESYQTYNDMLGALEGVKLELYRRRVADYERGKICLNGDIPFYEP